MFRVYNVVAQLYENSTIFSFISLLSCVLKKIYNMYRQICIVFFIGLVAIYAAPGNIILLTFSTKRQLHEMTDQTHKDTQVLLMKYV